MGDQFIGDLSKALRNVAVSRKRALQLMAGVIAVAAPAWLPRSAEAGKHRKPPLAFVAATVNQIMVNSPTAITWQITGVVAHPDSSYTTSFLMNRGVAADLPSDKVRADIVAGLKTYVASLLQNRQPSVPEDRIAVTLL
jgi:hypothetical protein